MERGRLTVRDSEARFSDIGPPPTPHHDQTDDVHPTVFSYWSRVVAAIIRYSDPAEHQFTPYNIRSDTHKRGSTFRTSAATCWEGNSTSATRFITWEEGPLRPSVGNGERLYECLGSRPPDRISHCSRGGPRCVNGQPPSQRC